MQGAYGGGSSPTAGSTATAGARDPEYRLLIAVVTTMGNRYSGSRPAGAAAIHLA